MSMSHLDIKLEGAGSDVTGHRTPIIIYLGSRRNLEEAHQIPHARHFSAETATSPR